eukprot:7180722-Pyramimonas_sp.AAC.1
MAEWATAKGEADGDPASWCALAVLLDLLKAYEQIRHHWLVEAAIDSGYPLWQLKLSLELYRAPRILSLGGASSDPILSEQSVLPGD